MSGSGRKRPTSTDVARRAGLSRATVSYVLNDTPGQTIPATTRERVLAAAAELNYTPHEAARTLRAGSSRLVLLITRALPVSTNTSGLLAAMTDGIIALGRSLVTWQEVPGAGLEQALEQLQPCLVIAQIGLSGDQRRLLDRMRLPLVTITDDGQLEPFGVEIGRRQADHLISRGHTRLGYVASSNPALAVFAEPRLRGVRLMCAERGVPEPRSMAIMHPDEAGVAAVVEALTAWRGAEPVTAIAAYNDAAAGVVVAAARTLGLAIPGDLAVIGMDDEQLGRFVGPGLTTLRMDLVTVATEALAEAAAVLDGGDPAPPRSPLRVALIARGST